MKRFEFNGIKLEHEECTNGCKGCVFDTDGIFKNEDCHQLYKEGKIPPCDSVCRTDRKDVIFIEIKNTKK